MGSAGHGVFPVAGGDGVMRRTLGLTIVSAVLVGAKPLPPPVPSPPTVTPALATMPGRLEVLTYNVKELPWPVASGRP